MSTSRPEVGRSKGNSNKGHRQRTRQHQCGLPPRTRTRRRTSKRKKAPVQPTTQTHATGAPFTIRRTQRLKLHHKTNPLRQSDRQGRKPLRTQTPPPSPLPSLRYLRPSLCLRPKLKPYPHPPLSRFPFTQTSLYKSSSTGRRVRRWPGRARLHQDTKTQSARTDQPIFLYACPNQPGS